MSVSRETFAYYLAEAENGWCKIPRRVADDMALYCANLEDKIAALAALDAETEVKPLEWVVPKSGYGQEAYSILGKYWVLHGQFWSPGCTVSKPCRDDAAAKAAAQADYERRIRSALVPPESRS